MTKLERAFFPWVILILLSAYAIYPSVLDPVEEHGYDAAVFHVYRGVLFSASRAAGILYPRWTQSINGGLGGPLFSFYPPLTYYAMDALHWLGAPLPIAWRLLVALALLGASVGMFGLARALSGSVTGALTAAAVFVYSFPLLRDFYERGSPEGIVVALYPCVLWALVRLMQQPSGWRLALLAVAWGVLFLTHTLSAIFLMPLFGVLGLLLVIRHGWKLWWVPITAVLFGGLLSAWYTLPFALEQEYVQIDNAFQADYARVAQNSLSLLDLAQLPQPYDVALDNNSIGEHVGPFPFLILFAGLGAGAFLWTRNNRKEALLLISVALFALLILWLQTPSANTIWENIGLLKWVQIRTRLLGLVSLSAALIAGHAVGLTREWWRTPVAASLITISILLAVPVLYPQLQYRYAAFSTNPTVEQAGAFGLENAVPGLTAFDEFLPIWRSFPFTSEEARQTVTDPIANLPEGGRTLNQERSPESLKVEFESPAVSTPAVRILYFPGWEGSIDGKASSLRPIDGPGYVQFGDVPAGRHTLTLEYRGTSVEALGAWVSLAASLVLVLGAAFWRGQVVAQGAPPMSASLEKPQTLKRWAFPVVLGLLLFAKVSWLDTRTTWMRTASECAAPGVEFGGKILLCSFYMPDPTVGTPGGTIKATMFWKTTGPVAQHLETFVQLLGTKYNPKTDSLLWGQQNKQRPGDHAITTWTDTSVYRDEYSIQIDPEAPPGAYQLEIGWWEPSTKRRLEPSIPRTEERVSSSDINSVLISGIVIR
jgi:hypothetical protein